MFLGVALFLLVPVVIVLLQARTALGPWRGTALGALLALVAGSAWCGLEWEYRQHEPLPENRTGFQPVSPESCAKCHEAQYLSWQRTYHRTMTREATAEFVKADFSGATYDRLGITSRMGRQGEQFFMETVHPGWEETMLARGVPLDKGGPAPTLRVPVDRLVGSHWFQQMMHRDTQGRYVRLPLIYHLVEKRWIHISGAFLRPDKGDFWGPVTYWNETCLYCHNTRVSKNPVAIPGQPPGYRSTVAELGISCEACHSAGERHVRAHQNPAGRLAQQNCGTADPTIINPARLSVAGADDVCARCHGVTTPRHDVWDANRQPDPFLPGRELSRFHKLYWSEAELLRRLGRTDVKNIPDGRFWGDGTPLTTALEYQSMALSACYQGGHGKLSCLSCHSMHQSDPNHQLKDGMRTNAACLGCHDTYRTRLTEHTHHAADSAGSLCYNCHMPYQVYSLLATHRSHRITIPRVRDSVGTGKPHACNLCHLDKSLGWTDEQLGKWYGTKPTALSADDRSRASSLLQLAQGDARTRAVVAGAFSWPAAHEASGRDWPALLLTRTLEHERFPAVRYLAQRALRSLHVEAADAYDYEGNAIQRAAQLRTIHQGLERAVPVNSARYPYLPLTPTGRFADDVFDHLLRSRHDPDLTINE